MAGGTATLIAVVDAVGSPQAGLVYYERRRCALEIALHIFLVRSRFGLMCPKKMLGEVTLIENTNTPLYWATTEHRRNSSSSAPTTAANAVGNREGNLQYHVVS